MQESLPFVSICLLTYHRAHELSGTIDSILSQTHSNFELIINDDNSPDETESICKKYERKDSRVKYFKNNTNLRYAENQNEALRRASSEYVAILHDGDIFRPDLIEKWLGALFHEAKVGLVFNAYRFIQPNGKEIIYREKLSAVTEGRRFLDYMFSRLDSPIFGIVMIRKSAANCVGQFDKRFPTLADIDMWIRILAAYDVAYIPEPLIEIHPREKGHHNNPGNINVRLQLEEIYLANASRIYKENPRLREEKTAEIKKLLFRKNCMSLFWCLKSFRLKHGASWLRFIFSSRIRYQKYLS